MIKTPLDAARRELESASELLADVTRDGYPWKPGVVESVRNSVRAFQRLVDDPDALESWWSGISPEGQRLILDEEENRNDRAT